MSFKIDLYHHIVGPADSPFERHVIGILQTLTGKVDHLMTQFDDIKAVVTELKKDNGRMISALADARRGLADANAKIDTLLQSTHLSDADQATLNDIQAIVTSTDADIEAAVPEVPAPPPVPEPTPEPAPAPVEPPPA